MKALNVQVGGLAIKINLIERENEGSLKKSARSRLESDLGKYFKDFISTYAVRKSDLEIDIDSDYDPVTTSWVYKDKTYALLFKKLSKKKIVTFYQISMYQFRFVFLYSLLSILVQKNLGFGLHCSAIIRSGKVDLFLGKSGAGKSTISRFLENDFIKLSDEISFIKRLGKNFFFYECPEVDKDWKGKRLEKYDIGNIYFLRKSKHYKRVKIDKEKALELFMEDGINISLDGSVKNIMSFIGSFDNFYVLHFAKNKADTLAFYKGFKNEI